MYERRTGGGCYSLLWPIREAPSKGVPFSGFRIYSTREGISHV